MLYVKQLYVLVTITLIWYPRVSGVAGGREREGVALLLSEWFLRCVVESKEVSSRLMWVRVNIGERVGCLYRHMDRVVKGVRRRLKSSGVS